MADTKATNPTPADPEEDLPERRHHEEATPGTSRRRVRPAPIGRLLLYYAAVVAALVLLAWAFPLVRHAYLSPIDAPIVDKKSVLAIAGVSTGAAAPTAAPNDELYPALVRTATTLLVVVGALVLALPVAWVYMFTKRLRYDVSLVQSIIILPVVVTGILMIVKNSVALAFGLAGIVAAVRFRNTLKDPKDAVYIFLVLGIGIASGVQALDIAIVLSLAFNLIVVALWKYNVGAIYSHEYGPRGILNVGDRRLMLAQVPAARNRLQQRMAAESDGMKTHGILLVHTADAEAARHAVEASLAAVAKDWRLAAVEPGEDGTETLEFLVQLKKKSSVVELLGELDDRWAAQVSAAEFLPFNAKKYLKEQEASSPEPAPAGDAAR
jgi:hypothetical protein